MTWRIYLLRCVTTDKLYVGQTKRTVAQRWRAHVHDALRRFGRVHCPALSKAIRKHGASTFETYLLWECGSREEANERERAWIIELGCRVPNGYNLDEGGGVTQRHPDTLARIGARTRAAWASASPERRTFWSARIREAALEKSDEAAERARKFWASMTPERKSEIAKKRWIDRTDRGAAARAIWTSLDPDERDRRLERIVGAGLKYTSARTAEQIKNASLAMVEGRRAAARARSHAAFLMELRGRCMAIVYIMSGPHAGERRKVRRGVYRKDWSPQIWVSLKGDRLRITSQVPNPQIQQNQSP